MYLPGDIIVQVDHTLKFRHRLDIRHHMMLVVDVTDYGRPVIAHMVLNKDDNSSGHLAIEVCPCILDSTYIHFPGLIDSARTTIQELANKYFESYTLNISKQYISRQYHEARSYHWRNKQEISEKLMLLKAEPVVEDDYAITDGQDISCHAFVLSVIYQACEQHSIALPDGLSIKPRLAWSDLLEASCSRCEELVVTKLKELQNIQKYDPKVFATKNEAPKTTSINHHGCSLIL